jgi:hypothetical protein
METGEVLYSDASSRPGIAAARPREQPADGRTLH